MMVDWLNTMNRGILAGFPVIIQTIKVVDSSTRYSSTHDSEYAL